MGLKSKQSMESLSHTGVQTGGAVITAARVGAALTMAGVIGAAAGVTEAGATGMDVAVAAPATPAPPVTDIGIF